MWRVNMLVRKASNGIENELHLIFNPDDRGDNLLIILLFNFMLSQPNAFVDSMGILNSVYHDAIVGMTQMDNPD
jgi:hypothetical protein